MQIMLRSCGAAPGKTFLVSPKPLHDKVLEAASADLNRIHECVTRRLAEFVVTLWADTGAKKPTRL
eukprot:5396097-Alexandrium_andersonii.AAC.1